MQLTIYDFRFMIYDLLIKNYHFQWHSRFYKNHAVIFVIPAKAGTGLI